MEEFNLSVTWHLKPGDDFRPGGYSQDHDWVFTGGVVVPASATTAFGGRVDRANPEEALVAAASSCHMLTFLAIAARHEAPVLSYIDAPSGVIDKLNGGVKAVTRITLRPRVVFSSDRGDDALLRLHASAQKHCFIANSLKSEITVEPQHEFRRRSGTTVRA